MYINVKINDYLLFIVNIVMRIRRVEYSFECFHLSLAEMNRGPSILDPVNLAKQCRSVEYSFLTVKTAPRKASSRVNRVAKISAELL